MAVSVAKLSLVIGAGLVGSALTNGGSLSDVTSLFSGALKIVTKHLNQDKNSSQSSGKSKSDALLTQVNILRQELEILASSRSVTIMGGSGSGSGTYGVTAFVFVGVVGYGYIWWKGWKISDMMFVTRRSFSDASNVVGKQIDLVSSSVLSTRQDLSSRIDPVENNLNENLELTVAAKDEVSVLHGDITGLQLDLESVKHEAKTLGTRLDRIGVSEDFALQGVYNLCLIAPGSEQCRNMEQNQVLPSSSLQIIELPQDTPITNAGSLPPLALELASPPPPKELAPPTIETPKVMRSSISLSASALKELQGISLGVHGSTRIPSIPRAAPLQTPGVPSFRELASTSSSSPGLFGWKLPAILSRRRNSGA